jgi:seryl-tRNA synthetase
MIDLKLLREQPEIVRRACEQKNVRVDIDAVLKFDTDRRQLQAKIDDLNRARNEAAKAKDVERGKALKKESAEVEAKLTEIETALEPLLLKIPNVPSEDTPVGKDDSENKVLRTVGEPTKFSFKAKDHLALGTALGLINTERAVEVSGTRFTYLLGDLVLLQNALHQYALSVVTSEATLKDIAGKAGLKVSTKPFTPVVPPLMIRPDVFQKMARLEPREERYHLATDDLFLIGSAEHTLGPLHMGETLKEADLPKRYVAFTPAFRREAGSYGKDTKGILRLHQFDKVEMESFTVAEDSIAEQNFMVAIQEHLMQGLQLPYRVVITCTGDQGDPDARHLDIETWMPGQNLYRETHSADLMTDYQARRLGTKVKRGKGSEFVHMNDATVIAIGRTLVAILENYQQEDGSITVPEVLRSWVGTDVIHA